MTKWLIAIWIGFIAAGLSSTGASAACGDKGVYLFDAYWCGYCKRIKGMFAQYNIRYTAIETTGNNRARAFMVEKFSTTSVPVTVIDDAFVIGFDENRIKQLLCIQ